MGLSTHTCWSVSLCLSKGLSLAAKNSDTHNRSEHPASPGCLACDMSSSPITHLWLCPAYTLQARLDFVGGPDMWGWGSRPKWVCL